MVETVELKDSNGQPILWRESWVIGAHTYTAEVTRDWMAGHGVFEGRYRWTVYFENAVRPIAGNGVKGDPSAARRAAEQWVAERHVLVAGQH